MQDNAQAVAIPDEVTQFLDGIITDANLVITDERVRKRMIQELFVELDRFLLARIAQTLPAGKLEVFLQEDKHPSIEKLTSYLQANIPDTQQFFQDTFADFRDMYLEGVDTSRSQQKEEKKGAN